MTTKEMITVLVVFTVLLGAVFLSLPTYMESQGFVHKDEIEAIKDSVATQILIDNTRMADSLYNQAMSKYEGLYLSFENIEADTGYVVKLKTLYVDSPEMDSLQ